MSSGPLQQQGVTAGWSLPALHLQQRTLVVAAPPGTISGPMIGAIEREFPWLNIRCVDHLGAALSSALDPVELILVDIYFLNQLQHCWDIFLSRYPHLRLALVSETQATGTPDELCSFDPKILRGVLALDVKLDVFLSSLRIILSGGTHFLAPQPRHSASTDAARPSGDNRPSPAHSAPHLSRLTARELEILGHLAQGNQNKTIATLLGLSEHTVKIHIHNLIGKLGVHNRTEAAACFLRDVPPRSNQQQVRPRA